MTSLVYDFCRQICNSRCTEDQVVAIQTRPSRVVAASCGQGSSIDSDRIQLLFRNGLDRSTPQFTSILIDGSDCLTNIIIGTVFRSRVSLPFLSCIRAQSVRISIAYGIPVRIPVEVQTAREADGVLLGESAGGGVEVAVAPVVLPAGVAAEADEASHPRGRSVAEVPAREIHPERRRRPGDLHAGLGGSAGRGGDPHPLLLAGGPDHRPESRRDG